MPNAHLKDGKATKIIAATSLLSTGILLAKEWTVLPPWTVPVLVSALFLLGVVLFIDTLYHPIADKLRLRTKIRDYRRKRRFNRGIKKNFHGFLRIINQFIEVIEIFSIPFVLHKLRAKVDEFSDLPVPDEMYYSNIVRAFSDGLSYSNMNVREFSRISNFFNDLIDHYFRYYIKETFNKVIEIGKEKVPEHLKTEYNRSCDIYCYFATCYETFMIEVNTQAGGALFRPYIPQRPKKLE